LDTLSGTYQSDVDVAGCFSHIPTSPPTTCSLKIIKVGLLNKKDDTSVGGKKAASRKWRPWTVVLTASHLLFFRDLSFANTICSYLEPFRERVKLPDSVAFKPDESLAICDSIAVYDQSYSKVNFSPDIYGQWLIILSIPTPCGLLCQMDVKLYFKHLTKKK
jgi:hypothetical protein